MDLVENRFNNFKAFLVEIAPDVQEVGLFSSLVPLDMFLDTLHLRAVTNGESVNELVDRICTKVNLTRDSFSPEIIAKFTRYIEYFIELTRETRD